MFNFSRTYSLLVVAFGVQLLLLIAIGYVGLHGVESLDQRLDRIVNERNRKSVLTVEMYHAARERGLLLHRMLLADDPFERDELALRLQAEALKFIQAGAALRDMPLNGAEQGMLNGVQRAVETAYQSHTQAIDLMRGEDQPLALRWVVEDTLPKQQQMLKALDQLRSYHEAASEEDAREAEEAADTSYQRLKTLGAAAILFSILVAAPVTLRILYLERNLRRAQVMADNANRAKGDFLANMSHEIRTPMNAVIGISQLALQTSLNPKQRDYLEKIYASGNSLLHIINEILDFSKIEAGRMEMEAIPFSLHEVVDQVAAMVAVKSREKGLELLFHINPDVPDALVGDPFRLAQVLTNLCNNAVKFTASGEIVVLVECVRQNKYQVGLSFSVRDTGIGMTEAQIARLFRPFSQGESGTTRKYGGTGLGLTISKRLVDLMGGELSLVGQPGEGCTFRFTAEFARSSRHANRYLTRTATFAGRRVLVVDDYEPSRRMLQAELESLSMRVDAVADMDKGLRLLRGEDGGDPFAVLFVDQRAPTSDELAMLRELRSLAPPKNQLPVVLLTARNIPEEPLVPSLYGPFRIVEKPLLRSKIITSLNHLLCADPAEAQRQPLDPPQAGLRLDGAKVLLAEDNEVNQQLAKELLEMVGCEVQLANNGREAVELALTQGPFELLLMDVQMPVMDGLTATMMIRQQRPAEQLPIVALTANAMSGDRERCLRVGMNDYLAKPIDTIKLYAMLKRYLPQRTSLATPVAPVAKTQGETNPVDLPGIDTALAMQRMMGNQEVFYRLLSRFDEAQSDTPLKIRQAIDVGDSESAKHLLHALKGVAGNLGATALQEAAARLEERLGTNDPQGIEMALQRFLAAAAVVFDGLHQWRQQPSRTAVASPPRAATPLSAPELEQQLTELAVRIKSGRIDAAEYFGRLSPHLPEPQQPQAAELAQQLERLDYTAAAQLLEQLMAKLCTTES